MRIRLLFTVTAALLLSNAVFAANTLRPNDFQEMCDSLSVDLEQHMRVRMNPDQKLKVNRIVNRGRTLDLYFSPELSYYPWHKEDVLWFRQRLNHYWKRFAPDYEPGRIISNRYELSADSELVLPYLHNDGSPETYAHTIKDPREGAEPFIREVGARTWADGLDGRCIALWQSHGLYYEASKDCWQWQRASMHRTVEDMFTPGFVIPYLIPMLENAGAYVLTPRERDFQTREIICDNDPAFKGNRDGNIRKAGAYSERGNWENAGTGFADFKRSYTFEDNPFKAGTARMHSCSEKGNASAVWTPDIEERGRYAVYISYASLPNSCKSAHYTVEHMAGKTEFTVNQKRGGGTWIYLGTFEFPEGKGCSIILDNRGEEGEVVSADAVKIGGGMGKLERGGRVSGVPSAFEGAHYWMQWAGTDKSITRNWDTDYTNDFASRGAWTVMMKEQKNLPVDLAFAFHTDAGLAQCDTLIGTLAIYTLRADGEREFSDGRDRIISRLLCDYVQTQVVSDLREDFDPDWTRRGLWDRSYSECRTAGVPAMILELMSHQNFADMKHGQDPDFRFTVCRAVYKGILKTLSEFYGCPYVVQPLPVHGFSCSLADGQKKVRLEWQPTVDDKEPTAEAKGYIVYTRIDGGEFDSGTEVSSPQFEMEIEKGHLYSFKVVAYNSGGKSFPSEILSAGVPAGSGNRKAVLIVNNFDRVSAPDWIDTEEHAGFLSGKDSGVPYLYDLTFRGENYEFDRSREFVSNYYAGFGASGNDYDGIRVAGNTFDYPAVHGKILMELGYPFFSMSREAFCASPAQSAGTLDLICGKQKTSTRGRGAVPARYEVFPEKLREALSDFSGAGGNIFISGSNIASDIEDSEFISSTFGYTLATPCGTSTGTVAGMAFSLQPNPELYSVESPDGLDPAGKDAGIWLRYRNNSPYGAAVYCKKPRYKSVALAVPLESLLEESDRFGILQAVMRYFDEGTALPK